MEVMNPWETKKRKTKMMMCITIIYKTDRRVCITKRKKQKARPKGVNLKVRWRAKVAMR